MAPRASARHTNRNPDRPRERLAAIGPASLSDAELLALVLRTGGRRADALGQGSGTIRELERIKSKLSELRELLASA